MQCCKKENNTKFYPIKSHQDLFLDVLMRLLRGFSCKLLWLIHEVQSKLSGSRNPFNWNFTVYAVSSGMSLYIFILPRLTASLQVLSRFQHPLLY